ncbi:hypothetical protein SLS62_003832 [Diatrype stigma]|uniref:Uncharacterized protein n=1 Tax=Diatrype stigma TaxID=117547 RepID=A0AAN9URX0_9PEZI
MQPSNIHDDEASLTELGYDIIGTDGESQAESTTSSLDYQRADDVQSLMGTDTGTDVDTNDVDTDSSDEEEEVTLHDDPSTSGHSLIVADDEAQEEEASVESLADQSLENPTNFEQYGIPHVSSLNSSQRFAQDLTIDADQIRSLITDKAFEEDAMQPELTPREKYSRQAKAHLDSAKFIYEATFDYIKQHRHVLIYQALILSGVAALSGFFVAGKYYLSSPPPRVLSTVPVAAVSSAAMSTPSNVASMPTPLTTPIVTTTKMANALQTGELLNGLSFLGRERTELQGPSLAPEQTICSAELFAHDEIIVKIPPNIKSSWLAKDAIMIAVSRGIYDIPTKVSSVEEGFLIQVPPQEAHGILDVSIATTRKPKVNEVFRVNFSKYHFTEALDAGKQLVKDFAQKMVDRVNGTTAWVEETYIPSFDVVSRQVCGQTASVTDSLLQTVRDAGAAALDLPTRLFSQVAQQVKPSLDSDKLAQRANQAHLELTRQTQDIRDELALGLLTAQLNSKLWWLKVQGKTEEHQSYMDKAAAYYKQKQADALDARRERAVRVKREVRARRHERQTTRMPFWKKGVGRS